MTDIALAITASFIDNASSAIAKVGSAFGPVGNAMAMATAGLADFGQQSIQIAKQYQQSSNMIQSLTGASTQQMQQYDTGVKQLAADTGVAATQLSGGLYNMISAGYSGSDALKMLTLSTKDAVIGMTNSTVTSNALTTVMRGFGVETKYADAVNGEMIRTVTAGKMTMQDYAGAVSKTSSTAVQYKDTMVDMNAVLATLTSNGIKSAAIAGTDYDNLLKVLNGDTSKMIAKAKALNPAFDGNAFSAMNVSDKIKYLNDEIVKHGHNITDVMGRQQNAAAAFTILANNTKMYGDNLKNLGDAQANANATQAAWAITQQGLQVTMNRVNAIVQNLMITLGNAFLPVLTQVMNAVANVVAAFSAWITSSGIVQAIASGLSAAFANVSTVIQNVVDVASGAFSDLPAQAENWGSNMMNGFISGVESMLGELVAIMDNVMQEVANFIGFASPSKKGPGRKLMTWGPAMIQSFAQGIVASGSSVQDAVAQVAQIASDGLQGVNASGAGSSAGASASSSFVSIGSGLQTVSLGHPFGMSGSTGAGAAKASPFAAATTALTAATTTHAAAIAASTTKHAAAVAAALAKHTAALQKHAAAQATTAAKHAAAVVKSTQATQALTTRLDATLQKALANSSSPGVQALVNQAKAAEASGNMAMARYYTSQASQLASQEKAAAKHATAQQTTAAKHAAAQAKQAQSAMAQQTRLNDTLKKAITDSNTPAVQALVNQAKAAEKSGNTAMAKVYASQALQLAEQQKAAEKVKKGKAGKLGAGGLSLPTGGAATPAQNGLAAVSNAVQNVTNTVNGVKGAVTGVSNTVKTSINATKAFLTNALNSLKPVWSAVVQGVLSIAQTVRTQLLPSLQDAWTSIKPLVMGLLDLAKNVALVAIQFGKWFLAVNGFGVIWNILTVSIRVILGILSVLISAIAKGLAPAFQQIVTTVKTQLWPALQALWLALQPLMPALGAVAAMLGGILLAALGLVIALLSGLVRALAVVLSGIVQFIAGTIQVFTGLIGFFTAFFTFIVDLFSGNWSKLGADTKAMAANLVQIFSGLWNMAQGIFKVALASLQAFASGFVDTIIQYFKNLYDTLVGHSIIPDLVKAIILWMANMATSVTKGVTTFVSGLITKFLNFGTSVGNIFANVAASAYNWGVNVVQGLINGVQSMAGQVGQTAANIANTIKNYIGWNSPTKLGPGSKSHTWGPTLVNDLAEGMEKNKGVVAQAAKSVAMAADPSTYAQAIAANYIHTAAGVALPNYDAGTGQTIADRQPVMASASSRSSSAPVIGQLHIHLDKDASPNDTKKVTDEVQKQLAKMVRGQAITPRYTSGGSR